MQTLPKLAALGLLAGVLSLVGCFDYEYEVAEIRDVMKGVVPSSADRYRVPAPDIPIVRKNIGIVREGGLFAIIVGPDLKAALREHPGPDVELGVHFRREPRRHLVLERIWADGQEFVVSEPGKFRYRLPELVNMTDIPFDRFDQTVALSDVPPESDEELARVKDRPIYARSFHVVKQPVPQPLLESELVPAATSRPDRPRYFITSPSADWLVSRPDPMTLLMLDYLAEENREFQGGIHVAEVFDRDARVATRVAGTARIDWIALGGPMYFKAR